MKESSAVQKVHRTPSIRLVTPDQMFDDMKNTFDAIARRAFEIFDTNGRRFGRDLDDWFQAEAELLHPVHVDISEADGTFTVRAEVPGFSEKDIEITVEPQRLIISGRREASEERKKGKHVYSERCSNQFYRAIDLPAEVDTKSSALKATYDHGVLTIALPKAGQAAGRQIKVEARPA
ncbi:MAG TPA: Hsp20/alpha crystallin family protein [Gemmatimonadales bacterium]|nr:Hsp20/alpha crystallin family protein [Gemmatimonadales bacterium]